eukprot:symbB.v1.2.012473.t2/scaffold861.1/size176854/3
MKVTHLVVFLPPALGAYVLSQHRTKVSSSLSSADAAPTQDESHTLRINQSSLLTPPAVIPHQAEQLANARRSAAQGSLALYTIPLLADTQTRSSKNRVTWILKFTLPAPSVAGATRRFSAVPRGYGPSGAQALEGAVRYAYPFNYQHEATTLLPNSDFLSLPDHVTQYGPVRAQTLGLYIPESIQQWLLSGAPRIYDRRDLELPGNRQIALPSILTRYFCSELTIHQFTALLTARAAEDDKELDAAATECRQMKRPKHQPFARLSHPEASGTTTSAPLAPAPPSPRIPDTGRSRSPAPGRPRLIGASESCWFGHCAGAAMLRIGRSSARASTEAKAKSKSEATEFGEEGWPVGAVLLTMDMLRGGKDGPNFGASAFFKWVNAAIADAPAGRPPLLINMDETALGYHFAGLRGTILRQRADSSAAPLDRASLSDVRGHVSYLASICDDVTVQDLLPQVLLGNEHRFTKQVLHSMEGKCPSNVKLWRQKSAWNSHATMRRYVCLLAKNLGVLLQQRYVILLVDTASVHIHMSIYKLARQRGLRLVYWFYLGKLTFDIHPASNVDMTKEVDDGIAKGRLKPLEEVVHLDEGEEVPLHSHQDREKLRRSSKGKGKGKGGKDGKGKGKGKEPQGKQDAGVRERMDKYLRSSAGTKAELKVTGDKKLQTQAKRRQRNDREAAFRLAKAEVLQTAEAGVIEAEDEDTTRLTQQEILESVGVGVARKYFNFDLPYGPYNCSLSRNGAHLLVGGRKGHVAGVLG